ncbi:MAG: ATP-binding protein [Bacteroidales bacterium]|nr:ATP-binding protein [Bacteroidales bacterium]
MKFINRQRELEYLGQEYDREGSTFVVIYGRRRLGKTALIKEFICDKSNVVYFLADKSSETVSINLFREVINRSSGSTFWPDIRLSTWDQLFDYYLGTTGMDVKKILIIDEFQYLVWSDRAFPSILQRIWDEKLKDQNIMLILCGSSVSMMLSEVLNYDSPLYGRRTGQIQIQPLNFLSLQEFIPHANPVFLAEIYGLTGGVPKYLDFFKERSSRDTLIQQTYLNVDHFLNQEARFILSEEINEPINYFSILKSIAGGNRKISSISNDLQYPSQKISPYLHTLQQIGLVERLVPVTETMPHKSKKGLYRIRDYYLRFWFRFVYPYQSDISLGNTRWLLEKIETEYSDFMGPVFEDICRQQIPYLFPGQYTRTGSWWNKLNETDIVCLNPDSKQVLIGECKWTNKYVGMDTLIQLTELAKMIDFGFHPASIHYILFSKSGFTKELLNHQHGNCTLVNHKETNFSRNPFNKPV